MTDFEKTIQTLRDNLAAVLIGFGSICALLLAIMFGVINTEQRASSVDSLVQSVTIGNTVLKLEVADSPAEQEYGLMNRTYLDADRGMLFVFADEQPRTFWMKDTLISLDIIFLDAQKRVVMIHKNTQPNQTVEVYPSGSPAKYVIEVNAGWSDQHGVKIGEILGIF